jgi:4-diphosphocytidyl-2-C-methyl-D-erythritol kinase
LKTVRLDTPAKLNLGLRVGPSRSDGFHEIRTIFQSISLFDRLTVEPSSEDRDSLTVQGPLTDVPGDQDNLVLQALRKLRDYGMSVPPLTIRLEKNIPTKAGLGGGSSDAAAMLRLAETEFADGTLKHSDRQRIARELGSDVPFFLTGGTALGRGRGADCRSVSGLQARVLLAVPPISVSTEWAYDQIEARESLKPVSDWYPMERKNIDRSDLNLTNDFEPVLRSNHELFDRLGEALGKYSNNVGLSGSGSTLYALFNETASITYDKEELKKEFPETRFIETSFLPESKLPKVERIVSCQSK